MIEVKHPFVSGKVDGPDGTKVQATNWNAGHTLTQAGQRMLGKPDAGAGATVEMDGAAVRAFAGAEASGAAAAAVAAHEAAGDPHPQYLTAAEGDALFLTPAEGNAAYEAAGAVAAHAGAADPHTGYQKELEKDAANGYAGVDANGAVLRAKALRETAGPTNLVVGAVADGEFVKRVGATLVGGTPSGAVAFSSAEVNIGAAPLARRSGKLQITGLAGLTAGKPVLIQQAVGPYTGKGTRADEAEMDQLHVTAKVLDAATIDIYWKSQHQVRGNFKFNYLVGA